MSKYRHHAKYQDIGKGLVCRIPEGWRLTRLRNLAVFKNSNVDKKSYEGQDQVFLCNYTDVYYNEFITSNIEFMQATASLPEIKQFALQKWDVIITKDSEDPSDIGISAIVKGDLVNVLCGYHLTVIRTGCPATSRLIHRTLQSHPSQAHFFMEASGITRYGLGQQAIGNLPVYLPPLQERASIADFIDRETARIDTLIAKKTRFIELLKEKRQAVITKAVTKGLDDSVEMRDSGEEWIGAIPKHWPSVKFNFVARVTEGLVDPKDRLYRDMVLIAPNHVESGTGRLLAQETAAEQNAESGKYTCKQGAVIYSKIRPALAKVVIAPCDCLCSADMYPMNCSEMATPEWLFYLMLSAPFTAWAVLESDRVAMPKINRESLSGLRVFVPPLEEQRSIVDYVNAQLARIDRLILKTERSIELLTEHRAALITAAVTGKIDVREAA
jgi:type I restriction enzyme S subunit